MATGRLYDEHNPLQLYVVTARRRQAEFMCVISRVSFTDSLLHARELLLKMIAGCKYKVIRTRKIDGTNFQDDIIETYRVWRFDSLS